MHCRGTQVQQGKRGAQDGSQDPKVGIMHDRSK